MDTRSDRMHAKKNHLQFVIAWIVVAGILMWRIPLFWKTGEFVGEDAWVFFAAAYNDSFLVSLLTPYAGYFHLIPRLIAEALSVLPLLWQPYAYAFVGIGLNAFIISLFFMPHFRKVVEDDWARFAIVVTLALAQNSENMGFLFGIHWYLAFGLPLLLLMEAPKSKLGQYCVIVGSALSIWSSPSNLILFPFFAYKWKFTSSDFIRKWSLISMVNLVLYAGFTIMFRLQNAERTGSFELSDLPAALERLILRGWVGCGILGQNIAGMLAKLSPFLLDGIAVLILGLLIWAIFKYRKTAFAEQAIILLGASVLMIFLSLTRSLYVTELGTIVLPRHVRYLTGPSLLLNLCVLVFAYRLLVKYPRGLFYGFWAIQSAVLLYGIPKLNHWARTADNFHLKEFVPAIEQFESDFDNTGESASLYIPMEVPYWGPVLIHGEGEYHDPDLGLANGLGLNPQENSSYESWMGKFIAIEGTIQIEHEKWGRLTYGGIADGRVWFRDLKGRLLFTSPLLYPRIWVMDGMNLQLQE